VRVQYQALICSMRIQTVTRDLPGWAEWLPPQNGSLFSKKAKEAR